MHPRRLALLGPFQLLQDYDVRCDLHARIALERVVGKPDGRYQIGAAGQVPAHLRILLVERSLRCDHRHHAARAHRVQGATEEVVVDERSLSVGVVRDGVVPEGDVAHHGVERALRDAALLETHGAYPRIGIELGGQARRERVELYARERHAHVLRTRAQEHPRAAGRLEDAAVFETHLLQQPPNGSRDGGRRVERVQGGRPHRRVLLRARDLLELGAHIVPEGGALGEGVGERAPSAVRGHFRLLLGSGLAALPLYGEEGSQGIDVRTGALPRASGDDGFRIHAPVPRPKGCVAVGIGGSGDFFHGRSRGGRGLGSRLGGAEVEDLLYPRECGRGGSLRSRPFLVGRLLFRFFRRRR